MRAVLYAHFGAGVDLATNRKVHAAARDILSAPPPGVTDVVPSYANLMLEYDPRRTSAQHLRQRLEAAEAQPDVEPGEHVIPVRYDGEDLAELAAWANLTPDEVVRRHANRSYHVYALGFAPGFPFMGVVDERLRKPRRGTPRARVPAHAVAITHEQTAIYPIASPGGWNLVGTALQAVYDPQRPQPFLIAPGAQVSFTPAEGPNPPDAEPYELLSAEPAKPALHVAKAGTQDLLMDDGRPWVSRMGLSRSGFADPLMAHLANRLVGNPPDTATLEMAVQGPTLEVLRPCVLAVTGWAMTPHGNRNHIEPFTTFAAAPGEVISFRPGTRAVRSYLAVAGGFATLPFMGSSSVDLRGRIGRPLRAGDVLGVARDRPARPGRSFVPWDPPLPRVTVRVAPGPQYAPEAMDALTSAPFTVESSDRVGARLRGPHVPGGELTSEATPIGAVQITRDGAPIILLHDRGSIGGYDKPALVHPGDLRRIAQLRPGDELRFVFQPRPALCHTTWPT